MSCFDGSLGLRKNTPLLLTRNPLIGCLSNYSAELNTFLLVLEILSPFRNWPNPQASLSSCFVLSYCSVKPCVRETPTPSHWDTSILWGLHLDISTIRYHCSTVPHPPPPPLLCKSSFTEGTRLGHLQVFT